MIPKIIHQMAPKNKDLWNFVWEKCHKSWKTQFAENEYNHIMWTDDKIDEFIELEFPQYIQFYYSLPFHIMQLDFARYCILYKYGGIYVDMDYFCFNNFYCDLKKDIAFVQAITHDELIQNSLMISNKNNHHLVKIMEKCQEEFYHYQIVEDFFNKVCPDYIRTICGPILISNYYNSLDEIKKEEIEILNCKDYNPPISLDIDIDDIKCMHMLTGSWGKESRKKSFQNKQKNLTYQNYSFEVWKNFRSVHYKKFSYIFE